MTHCQCLRPQTRADVSSEAMTCARRTFLADLLGRRQHWLQRALEDIGDRAFADVEAEDRPHNLFEALEADRLRDVEVDQQRLDAGAKW